jgi:branched-chain amino acid transport system ATP-binding protein
MLDIRDLHTYYGDSYVIQGVSLNVEEGTVVGVLGRNGMGKTTLVRSLIGLTPPRSGRVVFDGADITTLPPFKRTALGMALVPQGRDIFPSLTVKENLLIGAKKNGAWTLGEVFKLFPRLMERQKHWGNELSGGEQQMLAIARALMTDPRLLLMDEPTEGLAPLLVQLVGDTILELKKKRNTIVLVEQNLPMAVRVVDTANILSRGRIVHTSTGMELWKNERVKKEHLGL